MTDPGSIMNIIRRRGGDLDGQRIVVITHVSFRGERTAIGARRTVRLAVT